MNKHSFYRPTALGLALMSVASKPASIDPKKPMASTWVARRVLHNAENTKLGLTVEHSNVVR